MAKIIQSLVWLCALLAMIGCGRIGYGQPRERDATALDSALDSALPTPLACTELPAAGTVALYRFDADPEGVIADDVGDRNGSLMGAVVREPGPPGCGLALGFPGTIDDYATIPHDAAWDLPSGSVDLWVRFDAIAPTGIATGILSRASEGSVTNGDFALVASALQFVMAHVEEAGPDAPIRGICSPPTLEVGVWNHMGVNFGPPGIELWMNGQRYDEAGMFAPPWSGRGCPSDSIAGIDGNTNPWALGVLTWHSSEGVLDAFQHPLDGAIDHLRISSVRRSFAGPAYQAPREE